MAKPSVMASRRLFYALDQISKNTWIDVIVNHAKVRCLLNPRSGGVGPTDEDIADVIQAMLDSALAVRNDKPQSIARMVTQYDACIERYKAARRGGVIPLARPGDAKLATMPTLHNPEEPS
jgi:hypothetical protein